MKKALSKDDFQNIIDSMNDALVLVTFDCEDPENDNGCIPLIQKINHASSSLFGYTEEELTDKPLSLLFTDSTEPGVLNREQLHELFDSRKINDVEFFGRIKTGGHFPVLFSASVMNAPNKENLHPVICIIHDITTIRETEAHNRVLAKFPDENPNPVFRVSEEGQILYANNSSLPLLSAWQTEVGGSLPEEICREVLFVVGSEVSREMEIRLGILCYFFTAMPISDRKEIYLYGSDITEKKLAEETLLRNEASLKEAQRIAHIGNWTWDIPTGALSWSDEIYRIFGLKPLGFAATYEAFLDMIHPDDRARVLKAVDRALADEENYSINHRILLPDGTERIVHEQGEVTFDPLRNPLRMVGTVQDVTEAKKQEERLLLSAKVFAHSKEAIVVTNIDATIIDVNPAYTEITGYSREEMLNKNPSVLKSGKHDVDFYKRMWQSLIKTGEWQGEVWDRRKNGEIYPKWLSITSVKDEGGKTTNYVGIFTDLTQVKQTEERIRHLTNYDILTGLPNRVLFRDRLNQIIERTQREKSCCAIFFLDLDNFKAINDSLGMQAGDELLVEVSKRLSSCIGENDTVARFSADDFAIILTDVTMENIPFVAQWTIDTISDPFFIQEKELFITMSVGVSVFPNDGDDVETLLQKAISAMNFSRKSGESAYNFFSDAMNTGAIQRLKLATDLRHAVEREEFVIHYQPRVDVKTGRIAGMEALIRWNHPEDGLVPPYKFIPLAEETGLIVPMTEWIFRSSFRQVKAWEEAGFTGLKIGINLSSVHFKRADLVENFVMALQETGLSPDRVDLELTESIIMQDVEGTIRKLHDLKNLGCLLAIDDFGTGYSSLSYLKRFPIDILKIDQAFIRELTPDSYDAAIAKTIIVLAHSLKLKVIAEGVETIDHLDFLRQEDCDEIQGFYFSKPLPVDEFTELLKSGRSLPTRDISMDPGI